MNNIVPDRISAILTLVHDPLFVEFELEQEAPTVFNAVGRTHTETWHSALLGWLLDPNSSHSLGLFPLTRLLLFLSIQDTLPTATRGIDLKELLVTGDFSSARVRPNERELTEVTVGDMRFDVLIDGIKAELWDEVQLLIEVKVKAKINSEQNQKYINYIEEQKKKRILILPVFVAPTGKLKGTNVLGSETWLRVTYQDTNDEIIEPCLQHPTISQFGKFTLSEYVKTLKYRQQGGEPLSVTQKERDMANSLLEKHEPAIRALYEILSQ